MSLLKSKKFNIYLLASALLSLFFLLIVGQRGTIIGVVLGLTMFGFYNLKKNNFAIITGFVISISLLLFLRIIDLSSFEVFERFYELEKFREFERFQDYFTTWEIFENNSFWAGEGSYGYYFLTEREYPHNILLESISEYGLFGLISMMTIISTGLYYSIYLLRGKNILYEYKIIANIWIMLLISVLVSGNIVNNAIFFIFSGVLVLGYTLTKKTNKAHFRYNFLRFNSLNQLS
jgi:O-antigen ligase